jgi:hypothetical protein
MNSHIMVVTTTSTAIPGATDRKLVIDWVVGYVTLTTTGKATLDILDDTTVWTSISPNYGGAIASGGTYSFAPQLGDGAKIISSVGLASPTYMAQLAGNPAAAVVYMGYHFV